MRAGTRLSGWAGAGAGEGQHPLRGGRLPGLTICWSELGPARGFAIGSAGAIRGECGRCWRPARRPSIVREAVV